MIPFHGNQYPGQGGHYESWFVRANDPYRRRALWIRYTQFIAADGGRRGLGGLPRQTLPGVHVAGVGLVAVAHARGRLFGRVAAPRCRRARGVDV